jgi:outer membrane protein assembly factor BamB
LARFDSSGTAQWARTPNPGGSESFLNAVAVDSLGEIYVAGGVDGPGTYDFGPGVAIATNQEASRYVALVKYDSSGRSEWALSCTNEGSAANASFNSLTLGPAGDLYAAGIIVGAAVIDFGNDVTVSLAPPSPGGSPLLVKYH